MTIDQICNMTTLPTLLNALHACRSGHPLNNKFQWRNAYFLAAQRPSYEINLDAVFWLRDRALDEHNHEHRILSVDDSADTCGDCGVGAGEHAEDCPRL